MELKQYKISILAAAYFFNAATSYAQGCLPPVRNLGVSPPYDDYIQEAYDRANAGNTIEIQEGVFLENIIADLPGTIKIAGGKNCDYTSSNGTTTIVGNIEVKEGRLEIISGKINLQ